ncbi:MAG: hypothetical protein SFU27_01230 [Thermonemataceae bacterium]|nr:hypothetical protein [Thermonemataceae bacterium]
MTNIQLLHEPKAGVSAKPFFKAIEGNVTALQIQKGEQLKEHITKVEALLLCVSGKVGFENEKGFKQVLTTGDYIKIEPMVKHWVNGLENSQLVLVK